MKNTAIAIKPVTSEEDLMDAVMDMCKLMGLRTMHIRPAGAATGWPTLVIIGTTILYRQTKSDHGRLTDDQRGWMSWLTSAGQDAQVWRPQDLTSGTIMNELTAISSRSLPQTSKAWK